MSFFDLPPSAINLGALAAFLNERLPEGLNLDYKQQLSESVYETVAAMANTYGGIVLVGVGEDPNEPTRPLLPPVGVDPRDRERLVNQSYTRFQPPFAPDVVPVSLGNGREVLVIRVDPARAERPLVLTRGDDHKIIVRLEARNAPADRYRIAALFGEERGETAAVALAPGNWSLTRGSHYPLDDLSRPALAARVAVEARIPAERLERVVIDSRDRMALSGAMEHSPLGSWLSLQVAKWANSWSSSTWVQPEKPYTNLSWVATVRWRGSFDTGLEVPVGGQAVLLIPAGMRAFSGRLVLLLDASFDPDLLCDAIERSTGNRPSRSRLGLDDLYHLALALIATAVDTAAPATFPRILGIPVWERIGPMAYLHTYQGTGTQDQGLGHFLETDAFVRRTQPNLELPDATFTVPRTLDVEDEAQRSELVKEWLTRLLLDMGLGGFEEELSAL